MLTTTEKHNKYLPDDFYKKYVHSCIVNCVDCVIVRVNTITGEREFILVERKDQPAKGMFWFPGGRMFKGEVSRMRSEGRKAGAKRQHRTGRSEATAA